MKRALRNTLTAVLVILLAMSCLTVTAAAAGESVVGTIPVTVKMDGSTLPKEDTVAVSLSAVTPGAPMPEKSVITVRLDGSTGVGTGSFPITYTRVGVYQYQVRIGASDYYLADQDKGATIDVTVTVSNKMPNYDGFDVVIAAYPEGVTDPEEKCEVEDDVLYTDPVSVTVVKKWVDRDSKRPESITVKLIIDEKYADEVREAGLKLENYVVLSKDNNWSWTWTGLHPAWPVEVVETAVPEGYTATYKGDSLGKNQGVVYITNTGKWNGETLLQTGQLNWPIPVLCIAGVSILAMGVYLSRRKKEENG